MKKLILLLLAPTLVQAATFSDNVDVDLNWYDPTVSTKPIPTANDDFAVFDQVRIHAAAGYVSSFQDLVFSGERYRGGSQGLSLHFGIDLFSENWIAEGVIVNFPETDWGPTKVASNGFELRLAYEAPFIRAVTTKLGVGVSSRVFNVKVKPSIGQPGSERTFNSGASMIVGGIDYWPSSTLSLGAELSHHMAMSSSDDPSSFDLGVRLNGHF